MDEATDQELLALVVSRRTDAFEALYRRHAPAVHGLVRRRFSDLDLAADVTHAAFMRLWDRANVMAPDSRLRAWLTTVAHNAAVDRQRRKMYPTIPLMDALDAAATSRGPDDEAIMTELRRDIRAALRELPDDQRNVIELSFFGGLTQNEIAQLTGAPLGTIKGRVRLGMQRLRALITATGEMA